MKSLVIGARLGALGLLAGLSLSASAASSRGYPSYDDLMQARASVGAAQNQVQQLLGRLYGGGGSGSGGDDSGPRRGGDFPRLVSPNDYPRAVAGDEVLENDRLAGFALQGLGGSLSRLGQQIDNAAASFGQPQFPSLVQQACQTASQVLPQAQAGKTSAEIPSEVLIHGFDFQPIVQELFAVKGQLNCF